MKKIFSTIIATILLHDAAAKLQGGRYIVKYKNATVERDARSAQKVIRGLRDNDTAIEDGLDLQNHQPYRHLINTARQSNQQCPPGECLQEDIVGVYYIKEIDDNRRGRASQPSVCTTDIGLCYDIINPSRDDYDLTSGDVSVRIPAGSATLLPNAQINIRGNKLDVTRRTLQVDSTEEHTPKQERNLIELNRQLATVGTKTVLAVRVIHDGASDTSALSALAPSYSMGSLANDVFGPAIGGTDPVNLHSQYLACSHGKLDFQPTTSLNSNDAKVTNINDGVVEVTVSTICSAFCDGNMVNDVNVAINTAFGSPAFNLADYVMYCLPDGAFNGIAYGYVSGWQTVYSNEWCRYPSAQLHEIGHNLNLAHSNEGGIPYEDQSGFMGYSYSIDDQRMCFNNAKVSFCGCRCGTNHGIPEAHTNLFVHTLKSWQLGWFSSESITIGLNDQFKGTLKGQVNYNNGSSSNVLVKVEDPNSNLAYYVGFNHQVKHNSDTAEAGNQVTIQEYNNLNEYSPSTLIGKLSAGSSWNRSLGPSTVYVEVVTITLNNNDGVAAVCVYYGAPPVPECNFNPPTPPPTIPPPKPFCGNSVIDKKGEKCDGTDLDGQTCLTQGFCGGKLTCLKDCSGFNTNQCKECPIPSVCGDNDIDSGETCDGTDLDGKDCFDFGFCGGILSCEKDCSGFKTGGCTECSTNIVSSTNAANVVKKGGRQGRLCVPSNDGYEVTVDVKGEYKWLLHHGAYHAKECINPTRTNRSDKIYKTFCRRINREYHQLRAPMSTSNWLKTERWRRGTCNEVFNQDGDHFIKLTYHRTDVCICPCSCNEPYARRIRNRKRCDCICGCANPDAKRIYNGIDNMRGKNLFD